MSIESIVEKIIEDTKKASSEVRQRASNEVKIWEEKAEREVQGIMDAARERAARSARERKQRMISIADLEARKEFLQAKQEVIEEAFGRAIEKILSLDTQAYGAFLISLILQADPEGHEEILFNERDRERFGDGWINQLHNRLKQSKRKGEMRIAEETRSIQGGAILRRGRKEINCSLESVIVSKRNELETTVARILFRDSE